MENAGQGGRHGGQRRKMGGGGKGERQALKVLPNGANAASGELTSMTIRS